MAFTIGFALGAITAGVIAAIGVGKFLNLSETAIVDLTNKIKAKLGKK